MREIELRKFRYQICARHPNIAYRIVSFTDIWPDLHRYWKWTGLLEKGKSVHGRLDSARHGRDDYQIGGVGNHDLFRGCMPGFRERWVSVWVATLDVMNRLAMAGNVNERKFLVVHCYRGVAAPGFASGRSHAIGPTSGSYKVDKLWHMARSLHRAILERPSCMLVDSFVSIYFLSQVF